MCDLATEAVFAEAVVVVELDEGLWGVGVGARELGGGEFLCFVVLLGAKLMEKVEYGVLELWVASGLGVEE